MYQNRYWWVEFKCVWFKPWREIGKCDNFNETACRYRGSKAIKCNEYGVLLRRATFDDFDEGAKMIRRD